MNVEIIPADLNDPAHGAAIVELLDMYAREAIIGGQGLADDVRRDLIANLRRQDHCRAFLARQNDQAVGVAVCFLGFSTFRARPLLNIHDLAVVPQMRGRGIGKQLLAAVEQQARRLGCCRLTLEVRADNHIARRAYAGFGFDAGEENTSATSFLTKDL